MMLSGVISAMKTTLKNNKRDRKSAIKKLKDSGALDHTYKTELHFEKKATPYQLKKIREKVQRENRRIMTRNIVIVTILMILLIYFIGFAKF